LSLMRAGALDGLSIGFRTVTGRTDPKTGVRRLHKIDLWEISVVTFPMLAEARVDAVKRRTSREGDTPFETGARENARVHLSAHLHAGFKELAEKLHAAGGRTPNACLTGAIRRAAASLQSSPKRTI